MAGREGGARAQGAQAWCRQSHSFEFRTACPVLVPVPPSISDTWKLDSGKFQRSLLRRPAQPSALAEGSQQQQRAQLQVVHPSQGRYHSQGCWRPGGQGAQHCTGEQGLPGASSACRQRGGSPRQSLRDRLASGLWSITEPDAPVAGTAEAHGVQAQADARLLAGLQGTGSYGTTGNTRACASPVPLRPRTPRTA